MLNWNFERWRSSTVMVFSDMNERLHKMWLLAETTMHTAILRESSPFRFNLDQFLP
jgi:hypothetical protein